MRRLLFWLHRFEDGLIVTVLLGMVLLAVAQI
ncbi:MAG TPA: TRAP transporter small permease, partial [Alcanivorax sp.]|nr:TRAP transporter small permease [Alcanivorax sp.]